MKLQGLGIVFAIIILPVIIILSYYIQLSVDTVALQTSYKTKLNNSTYDSMLAFEMNTANENLSTVADSLRSIIEASNSVFFDSLASNFGMSNASISLFQAYVPAILYTLYDGYYIYTPNEQPELLTYQDWMENGLTYVEEDGQSVYKVSFGTASNSPEIVINKNDVTSKGGQPIYTNYGEFVYKLKKSNNPLADYPEAKQIGSDYYSPVIQEKTSYKLDYVLKSYMPYAARYVHKDADNDIDVTINYTLDNYMNIMGNVNNVYYAKTGYLIDPDMVEIVEVKGYDENGNQIGEPRDASGNIIDGAYIKRLNEDEAEELCLSGEYKITLNIKCKSTTNGTDNDSFRIISDPRALDVGDDFNSSGAREDEIQSQLNADYSNWHDNSYGHDPDEAARLLGRIQTEEAELANIRAVAYYVRNSIFSDWVYENLSSIEATDIQNNIIENTVSQYLTSIGNTYSNNTASVDTLFKVFKGDTTKIFGNSKQDTDLESAFTNHKDGVIRNSIQYNLDLAFSAYTKMYTGYLTFQMPVISDAEWGRIINNVSVVSFMQGMPCGTKNFSSYSIVNSTNNELTVIPSELYYVPATDFNDEDTELHRVDCEEFTYGVTAINDVCSKYVTVKSNDVKYDGIYNKNKTQYEYSFRNLFDYNCIINKNLRESKYAIGGTNDRVQMLDPGKWTGGDDSQNNYRRQAYYTGLAEQRQKLYKTNALKTSSGYTYNKLGGTVGHFSTTDGGNNNYITINLAQGKSLKDVKEFEIYLESFQVTNSNSIVISMDAKDSTHTVPLELYGKNDSGYDIWVGSRGYSDLDPGNGANQTIRARCHCTESDNSNQINLIFNETEDNIWVTGDSLGVKVIYK